MFVQYSCEADQLYSLGLKISMGKKVSIALGLKINMGKQASSRQAKRNKSTNITNYKCI